MEPKSCGCDDPGNILFSVNSGFKLAEDELIIKIVPLIEESTFDFYPS